MRARIFCGGGSRSVARSPLGPDTIAGEAVCDALVGDTTVRAGGAPRSPSRRAGDPPGSPPPSQSVTLMVVTITADLISYPAQTLRHGIWRGRF